LNKYYYDIRREDGKQERKGLPIYYLSRARATDSQHWMPVGDQGPYKCDQCNGTGKFPPGKTCPRCGGSGIMNQNDPVILNVGDRVKYDKQPPVYTVTSKSYNTSLNKYYYDIRREDGKQERKGLPIYYLSKV
jgi:DnaJ-class molecular chaperone